MIQYIDVAIIGGGPAGLAAAIAAKTNGTENVLIIERGDELGGILNQCIHSGFGLHHFKEELTGPEYALRYINKAKDMGVKFLLSSICIEITPDKQIFVSSDGHFLVIKAIAIVLAMGCRERTRGAISIPGTRPAGVLCAGTAQQYVNMEGLQVGKRVVILGSGDIGLIMARRITLEGAKVLCCVEIMPFSGGLNRNIVQCLHDFDIPLYLSHTVTEIRGKNRVEQVLVSKVDENRQVIPGTEMVFDCDTLLLSVGLIPENELSRKAGIEIDPLTNGPVVFEDRETSICGIYAAGNVVQVHDLVDFVSGEAEIAGRAAAKNSCLQNEKFIKILPGDGISYTVPQKIRPERIQDNIEIYFRVNNRYDTGTITVTSGEDIILSKKRRYLNPSEMEHITISKEIIGCKTLTVSVEG